MKRNLLHIIIMLLALPAAFSCEAVLALDKVEAPDSDNLSLVITGTVSDFSTDGALEGIKILFSAYPKEKGDKALSEMNVYTDNHGVYRIEAAGFSEAITCTLTACDTEDLYVEATQEVEVAWSGVAFDAMNEKFVVNDCNFKLEKK